MERSTEGQTAGELPLGLAIAFCLASRVAFNQLYGLTYVLDVNWWQMLDTELLRTAPLQSIYLMHPPLLNGLFASALALPDGMGFVVLRILFLGSSLAILAMLYVFLRQFGARPYAAGFAVALFGVLPQVLLYENTYFYSHLEAVLVLAAAISASAYFKRQRLVFFVSFAACLVVLGLLRSLFHLGWIALVLGISCALGSRHKEWDRRVVLVAVGSIILVGVVYLKNLWEFGIFSASSWDGVSLMSMALPTRSGDAAKFPHVIEDIRRRADGGEFSPATIAAFERPNVWTGWVAFATDCAAGEQQRALCAVERSNGGLNFNNVAMIDYSRSLVRDAWHMLRLYPRVYVDHVGSSAFTFLGTRSWDYLTMPLRLRTYTEAGNSVLLYQSVLGLRGPGQPSDTWWDSAMNRVRAGSLPLIIIVSVSSAFIVLIGIRDAIRYWRGIQPTADWVVPMLVIVLFASVPNLTNGVEAQRIRYSVEPLIYLGFVTMVMHLFRRRRRSAC
jgi:hypothetical protein